jgi:hypothetical protein
LLPEGQKVVAEAHRLLKAMGGQHEGEALALHHLIKEGQGGFAPGWVQIGKGFIEQQPRRRSQHGAS